MSLIQVKITGVDGVEWHIATTGPVARGVMLEAVSGLTSKVTRSALARSTGRGADVGGYVLPEMEGALKLRIFADKQQAQTLGEVYDGILSAVSTTEECALDVVDGRGVQWGSNRVLLTTEVDPPTPSPHTIGLRDITIELPLTILDGALARETTWGDPSTTQTVKVPNRGSLNTHPTIRWDGKPGRTVTLPTRQNVTLPTAPGWRHLSTDPGTGYVVTDDTGKVDVTTWAAMRGLAVPGLIRPRAATTWTLPIGADLILTEYTTNVWR